MSKLKLALITATCALSGVGVGAATLAQMAPAAAATPTPVPLVRTAGLTQQEAANAHAAVELLNGSFTKGEPRKYADKYIDAHTYIQHNPTFANGREAFIEGVEGFLKQAPELTRPLTRVITQGSLVVVEGSVKTGPEDRGTVIDDTFRFDREGKIVEHWDAIQPVAESSLNGNPQV